MRAASCLFLLQFVSLVLADNSDQSSFYGCPCEGEFSCMCVVKGACFQDGSINYNKLGNIYLFSPTKYVEKCDVGERCCHRILNVNQPQVASPNVLPPKRYSHVTNWQYSRPTPWSWQSTSRPTPWYWPSTLTTTPRVFTSKLSTPSTQYFPTLLPISSSPSSQSLPSLPYLPIAAHKDSASNGTLQGTDLVCFPGRSEREELTGNEVGDEKSSPNIALFAWGNYKWQLRCGAALLTKNIVLTAAHCVDRYEDDLRDMKLGVWNPKRPTNYFRDIDIAEVIIHSKFNRKNGRFDIALIKTNEDIQKQTTDDGVCFLKKIVSLPMNSSCVATTWIRGTCGQPDIPKSRIKQVEKVLLPRNECSEIFQDSIPEKSFNVSKDYVCSSAVTKTETDQVIGGSPLVCKYMNQQLLMGVASWNFPGEEKFLPRLYTNVTQFRRWIQRIVRLLNKKRRVKKNRCQ